METVLWDAIEALVTAVDMTVNTPNHSLNVARYSLEIGRSIGMQAQALQELRVGALLHDIGKLLFPHEILREQDTSLSKKQQELIRAHTNQGAELVRNWLSLDFVIPYILYHQEWVDGTGYPLGLKGKNIPIAVQIVSLADVYEALRHPREYQGRRGFSHREAMDIMAEMRGKRWNPELFDSFVQCSTDLE